MNPTLPLILASSSPRRRELIALLDLPVEIVPSAFEEPSPESHPDPAAFAEQLALGKAQDVARRYPGKLVIGADTIVTLDGRLYAKPQDFEDGVRILMELSGKTHTVITGLALVQDDEVDTFHCVTEVRFRDFSEREARAYMATGEPMDKAGAYGIQQRGMLLIAGLSGDYPNVVGLPLTPLAERLRGHGYSILTIAGGE